MRTLDPLGRREALGYLSSSMDETSILKVAAPVCALAFILGAVLSYKLMRRGWARCLRFMEQGGLAEGTVVAHLPRSLTSEHGISDGFALLVEYRDRTGTPHRIESGSVATHPSPIGTPVRVAYDPRAPGEARLADEARTLARVGTGLAALLLLGAAGNLALLIIL